MTYIYYPGCAVKTSGKPYEESLLAVFEALGIRMDELKDWNCCGATSYMSIDETQAFALAARNLALAEQQGGPEEINVVAPCSACYMVLSKTKHYLDNDQKIGENVRASLKSAGLKYDGRIRVRHALDVLVNDVGLDRIKRAVKKPLKNLHVASYYGCQVVRPFKEFDDPRNPSTMDRLAEALGASAVAWPLKTRCCGGALINTMHDVGLRLSYHILSEAQKRKADVILTACPLCQFNLECFRGEMGKQFGEELTIPAIYFTQLVGMAFGLPGKQLGVQRTLVAPTCVTALTEG